nr:siderophore-interacting protein [Streptomyces taklimakanensis]
MLRGKDFVLTVIETEPVTEHYRRIRVSDGGMLAATGVHPTMWVRLWFDDAGKPHQRAYTLVDPDPDAGTFDLEFALHRGVACDWARAARPGDTIEATVHGTGFGTPDPAPSRLLVVGDPASLPAVNSLLDSFPDTPATVWFETAHEGDTELPLRLDPARHELRWVPREGAGARLVTEVTAALPGSVAAEPAPYVWIACDTATTRALAAHARKQAAVPRERLHALGYWRAT